MKEMKQAPFGPPGTFEIESRGGLPLSEKGKEGAFPGLPFAGKEELLSSEKGAGFELSPEAMAAKIGMESEEAFPFPEGATRFPGIPEGVVAPKGEKGVKYIGSLPSEESMQAGYMGLARPEEKTGSGIPIERRKPEEWIAKKETPFGEPIQKEEREEERGKKKSEKEAMQALQLTPPTLTPLPDFVIPMATQATVAAAPYLGSEALAIYFHMVGTITAMVSPKGDSLTEFVLNAPSFAQSKFYGATISIERFATAPYQLNIRLTGSNAAVNLFKENIPNLLQAFQNKNFAFTINRIEAVYEKPLFRRKESVGEKEEKEKGFGGGSDMDQRKGQ